MKRRRFQFFDKIQLKEGDLNLQKFQISCATSGRGKLVFGDSSGLIHLCDRNFTITSFKAFEQRATHLNQMKQSNILVAVGDDDADLLKPQLKIFSYDKSDKNNFPLCIKDIRILMGKNSPSTVAFLAVKEDMTQMAVGFANGVVVIIYGDLLHDRSPRQKILQSEGSAPVTALIFAEKSSNKQCTLFVVTSKQIIGFNTTNIQTNSNKIPETELDFQGGDLGAVTLSDDGDLIVGRDEAVYFYEADGRGPCFAFEGQEKKLSWFRTYLLVVGCDKNKNWSMNIYDLKNKFINFSATFSDVTYVISEWGSIFVIGKDGKGFRLDEKDTQTKLDTLFKKHLYVNAINLAHSQQYDYASLIDIFRSYGDHLYSKKDFDAAIKQYTKTIGRLEPSYVIRKFLDAQRIHNLTFYLQALHEKNVATADHTSLLLNCYTKLKDTDRLNKFIETDAELHFDVDTAIKVLRSAGYFTAALYLAMKHGEHESYLRIQLDDVKDYAQALNYIWHLPFAQAQKNVKKYGKTLISFLPEETTRLLMSLCTGFQPLERKDKADDYKPSILAARSTNTLNATSDNNDGKPTQSSQPSQQSHDLTSGLLFRQDTANNITVNNSASVPSFPTSSSSTLFSSGGGGGNANSGKRQLANAEEFIHIFVDQPEYLTRFLEYIISEAQKKQNSPDCPFISPLLFNTLIEIYLRIAASSTSENRFDRVMALLQSSFANYDKDHVLGLCQMHGCQPGVLYLYEKLKLYFEILQYYMDNNMHDEVLKCCKRYGEKDANLWVQVLSYFAAKEDECENEILQALQFIDRDNILPPLLVIQVLAQKTSTKLKVVKDYISRRLQQENLLINEDQRQIRDYRAETKKMRDEIEELKTQARMFQATKCASCNSDLDLPAVHFLCMHSFHQRCLVDNENECPSCAPTNHQVLEIKRTLEQSANDHDQFEKQLVGSVDGFTTVSEYFGRGIFNRVLIVEKPAQSSRTKKNFQ